MLVWVLIFYTTAGFVTVDNIRAQANCEALATVMAADIKSLTNISPPHRCVAVMKR